MKRLLFAAFLSLSLAACQKDKQDPQPGYLPSETKDWYILRSPDDQAIEAVAGDIDGTLTITTGYRVYQTKDRGNNWVTGNYADNTIIKGLLQKQDTLLALSVSPLVGLADRKVFAINPFRFSLDQGLTWQAYVEKVGPNRLRVDLDRLTTATGTLYSIEYLLTPVSGTGPPSTGVIFNYVESIGVETSTGQHITLPQQHQLSGIYFDAKTRLYVFGSAPMCGRGKDFKFCGKNKGTLYISKQPQP